MIYTNELTEYVTDNIHIYYDKLLSGGLTLGIAIFIMSIVLTLWLYVWTINKLIDDSNHEVSRYPHFIFIACIIIYSLGLISNIQHTTLGIILFVFLCILAFVSLYLLITVRLSGPILTALWLWSRALYLAIPNIGYVLDDACKIDSFDITAIYAIYTSSDFIIMKYLLLETVIAIFAPIMLAYYMRYQRWVYGNNGRVRIKLEKAKLVDSPEEIISNFKKSAVVFVLIVIIIYIPTMLVNLPSYFTKGDTEANNTYVAYMAEYRKDNSVYMDDEWLIEFNEAYSALEEVNFRVFNVNPRRLNYNNVIFLADYSSASYIQLLAMGKQYDLVMKGEIKGFEQAMDAFDYSNNLKLQAMTNAMSFIGSQQDDIIASFINTMVSSYKFYLSFFSLKTIGIIMLVLFLLIAVLLLLFMIFVADREMVSIKNFITESRKNYVYRAPDKKEVLRWIAVWSIAIILLIIIPLIRYNEKPVKDYPTVTTNAIIDTAIPVYSVLTKRNMSPDEIKDAIELIDNQLYAIEMLMNYQDVDSEYKNTQDSFLVLLPSLADTIKEIRNCLMNGVMPDDDIIRRYAYLEKTLMNEAEYVLVYDSFSEVLEVFD